MRSSTRGKNHVSKGGDRIPLEAKLFEPSMRWMTQRYFQHEPARQLIPPKPTSRLNNERQKVKSPGGGRRLPTKLARQASQFHIHGIPQNITLRHFMGGIAQKLMIPNTHFILFSVPLRKNGHERLNASACRGPVKMRTHGFKNLVAAIRGAGIQDLKRLPVQAPHAARRVAPSGTCSCREIIRCRHIHAGHLCTQIPTSKRIPAVDGAGRDRTGIHSRARKAARRHTPAKSPRREKTP